MTRSTVTLRSLPASPRVVLLRALVLGQAVLWLLIERLSRTPKVPDRLRRRLSNVGVILRNLAGGTIVDDPKTQTGGNFARKVLDWAYRHLLPPAPRKTATR